MMKNFENVLREGNKKADIKQDVEEVPFLVLPPDKLGQVAGAEHDFLQVSAKE